MKQDKHPLEETDWPLVSIICYRGVLVERVIGGYKVFQRVVETPDEVDKAIEDAAKWLGKSIKE